MNKILFFILIALISSCKHKQFNDSDFFSTQDFVETQRLTGKEVKFDKPLLRPVRIDLVDSTLVFQNINTDKHFQKYNINTRKLINYCIKFGSGPEEMLYPKGIQIIDSIIWICDVSRRKMYAYQKYDFCNNPSPKSIQTINFSEQFNQVKWLDDTFVSTVLSPNKQRLSFYQMDGSLLKSSGNFPEFGEKLTQIETIESFLCNISVSPQNGRICLSYNRTDLIEFYDSSGEFIKRIHGPDHFFPLVVEEKKGNGVGIRSIDGKTRDAYFSPVVTKDHIFLLYSGRFFDSKNMDGLYLVNQILVFDWNGKPLKRYLLDVAIFWFTLDEKQNKIYGLTDSPDYRVFEFQL